MTAPAVAAWRPWATSADVAAVVRALYRAAEALGAGPFAVVVLGPGAFAPESIPAAAWRDAGGRPVAVVGLALARELAAARAPSCARALALPPPARCAWCLALDARGGAITWSTPVVAPGQRAEGGDA